MRTNSQQYRKPDVFLNHNSGVFTVRFNPEGRLGHLVTPGQCYVFRNVPKDAGIAETCGATGSVEEYKLFNNMLLAAGKVILGTDDNVRLDGTTDYTVPMHLDRAEDVERIALNKTWWQLLQECVDELHQAGR